MNHNFKVNNRDLNLQEQKTLTNFLFSIARKTNTKLLFRGESRDNISKKLEIKDYDDFIVKLNYFTFQIGEKGRIYQQEFSNKISKKSTFSIKDISDKFFSYIFDKLNNIVNKSKNTEIINFKQENFNFTSYFKDKEFKKDFISKIQILSIEEKLLVRDYYLIFLHRVGYLGFYYNTFFLSTTLSEDIAKEFTNSKDIIFVSWKTLPIKRKIDDVLSKNDLPIIVKNIYIRQNEISVKGALFPQDILGFIDKSTNDFHVNPNLFNYPDLIDYMILNGIPIDQSNFFEVLKKTNHSGYTVKDEKNYNDNL